MPAFRSSDRTEMMEFVLNLGQADRRIRGAAVFGSLATESYDAWSDLDIGFSVAAPAKLIEVLEEWFTQIANNYEVTDHFDVHSGNAIYRVILFSNGLEMDLSVFPEKDFIARTPAYRLIYGRITEPESYDSEDPQIMIGWCWHHILHAHSAIERNKLMQAEYWLGMLKNYLISIKCLRYGLPHAHGRGADKLPEEELKRLKDITIAQFSRETLQVNLKTLKDMYIEELRAINTSLSQKLELLFSKHFKSE